MKTKKFIIEYEETVYYQEEIKAEDRAEAETIFLKLFEDNKIEPEETSGYFIDKE